MLKIAEYDLLKEDTYTDELLSRLQDDYATGEENEDGKCYEVTIQDYSFRCVYSDDEIRGIIRTCVKIINELISINADGFTKDKLEDFEANDEDNWKNIEKGLNRCSSFTTLRLELLILEMTSYTRVTGAYYLLIAGPGFRDIIYSVFEVMLDDSDNEELWFADLYFMIRGAMKMHSSEL